MKHKLEVVKPVAIKLWKQLKPHCAKIKIAGSIRREKEKCKDIELVLLPVNDSARNKIGAFFLQHGRVLKGKFSGRYVKATYQDYAVDVFIPQKRDFYRQLAIRTGSADFAKRIATAWVDKGYKGTERGLVPADNLDWMPLSWESEKHFFEWLGMDFLHPRDRH